ncbi:hypothetical protein BN940_06006 [Castellaniella defragrans 65Phen]|uniref:Uncharacterized protein n=1 Tax=Castellaniella defragrans (strain DSM 12143 / CCUG 39792 / 65Phen) TaxID=1437824 RepID=W8X8U2_CASD6|nr:hypothetical protein BN940_06006 [Castellaniella defragrans 65Phen]
MHSSPGSVSAAHSPCELDCFPMQQLIHHVRFLGPRLVYGKPPFVVHFAPR